jgi:hypothetical protein
MKTRTSSCFFQCASPFRERATVDLALKLTANMEHAMSAHGDPVILKLTHQHEVEVLRRPHANQTTEQTRITPLLDVVDERLMVLPLRTPSLHFLNFKASVSYIELLDLQFLEGVAHLQHCSVAPLDLKPGNVVVQWDLSRKRWTSTSLISTFPFLTTLNRQSLPRAAPLDGGLLGRTTPSWQAGGHAAASSWCLRNV